MRYKLLAAVFLLFTVNSSLAQNLEVYNPPTSSTAPGYTDLFLHILSQPNVKGITTLLQWGSVDTGTTGPCTESTCNWSAIDPILRAYIGGVTPGGLSSHPGQKLNLTISIIPESNSLQGGNSIPKYVFDQTTYTLDGVPVVLRRIWQRARCGRARTARPPAARLDQITHAKRPTMAFGI
jgi:hypothetical protein